ncbi:unnamed protein product [Periconia digitata]|uniref:Uncharacterized protein n=1 Tax=Periconia digitata TaxID=1303443 RepID=A0A9W4UL35_9PLEO|nr:unnamed protein product [Periconia digitata]
MMQITGLEQLRSGSAVDRHALFPSVQLILSTCVLTNILVSQTVIPAPLALLSRTAEGRHTSVPV